MAEKRELRFAGIDYWSRPRFEDRKGYYFGSLEKLFLDNATFEHVTETGNERKEVVTTDDIYFFGVEWDCDPEGWKVEPSKITLVKEFTDERIESNTVGE